MLKNYASRLLEKAVNHYLALDPASRHRLQPLEGKVVTICWLPKGTFQMRFMDNQIYFSEQETYPADIKITATPFALLAFSVAAHKQPFFEEVVIEGNAELGQQVLHLFTQLDIDWEDYLSQVVGDIPAYSVSRLSKGVSAFVGTLKERLLQNTAEYIHEEACWLPPAEAVNDFLHEVDELRLAADRLEARIKKMQEAAK